jgi:hypothetical protein
VFTTLLPRGGKPYALLRPTASILLRRGSARKLNVLCIQDDRGSILLHRNLPTCREAFQAAVQPYGEDLAVAVECVFSWYWIADLCSQLNGAFLLGHALYMKAIHGGKTKNDKIDSKKVASLPARQGASGGLCLPPGNSLNS